MSVLRDGLGLASELAKLGTELLRYRGISRREVIRTWREQLKLRRRSEQLGRRPRR